MKCVWYNLEGSRESRSFSIKKYGRATAIELATNIRVVAIKQLNDNGAGYTDRHGKVI